MKFKFFFLSFMFIFVLMILTACNLWADTIYLKSGESFEGKIVKQNDNFLTIERVNDQPIVLSIHEIEAIGSLQPVKQELIDFEPFQEHYGIKYDLSPLAPVFDPYELIKSVTNLNLELETSIEGVIVLNTVEVDIARIVRTAILKKPDATVENSKFVLFLSPDLARTPDQIIRILKKETRKTPEQVEKERIALIQRGEVAKIFDGENRSNETGERIGAQIVKSSNNFIQLINDLMDGKFRKKKNVEIEDYYLSFSQLFIQKQNLSPDSITGDSQIPISGPFIQRKYYPSGGLAAEYSYYDGVLSGVSKEYGENGVLRAELSYRDNELDGNIILYSESGKILKEIGYLNGKENGVYKEYYDSGALHIEMKLKDGNRDEFFKEYFENGKLKYAENYVNGKVDGMVQEFYETGKLKFEFNYQNGDLTGQVKEYYETGKVHFVSNYVDEKKNGPAYEYADTGELLAEYNYVDDKLDGTFKIYNSDGSIMKRGEYYKGEVTDVYDVKN